MSAVALHPHLRRGTSNINLEGGGGSPITPPATKTTIWGTGDGVSVSNFNTFQDPTLHSRAFYYYGTTGVKYSAISSINSNRDIALQTKETTRAAFDTMLATFPANRAGKIYLHYYNEPEDNMTASAYLAVVTNLYAAIDAAGLPYVVKAQELNGFKLFPVSKWNEAAWVHPDAEHIGWSVFAGFKVDSNGHGTWKYDPNQTADQLNAFHTGSGPAAGVPFSAFTFGQAIPDANWSDTQTHVNRVTWADRCAPALIDYGVQHLMWYDQYYTQKDGTHTDYRIDSSDRTPPDVSLKNWWLDPSRAGGQA